MKRLLALPIALIILTPVSYALKDISAILVDKQTEIGYINEDDKGRNKFAETIKNAKERQDAVEEKLMSEISMCFLLENPVVAVPTGWPTASEANLNKEMEEKVFAAYLTKYPAKTASDIQREKVVEIINEENTKYKNDLITRIAGITGSSKKLISEYISAMEKYKNIDHNKIAAWRLMDREEMKDKVIGAREVYDSYTPKLRKLSPFGNHEPRLYITNTVIDNVIFVYQVGDFILYTFSEINGDYYIHQVMLPTSYEVTTYNMQFDSKAFKEELKSKNIVK
ncbi:MAG: hypothetical protein LBI01_03080 [Elusimicrobium sp.]|jgi:hypothetical protein|nr:hypothetical protein [Elusimicrobium sp.]